MASQIEQTVDSLTTLSEQYSSKLQDFFKKNDDWFLGFRSSTLANIKSALRKIESQAAQHPSPVKALRKKARRKVRKGTRIRRNKNRPKPRSPVVTASDQRADALGIGSKSVRVASPSQELFLTERLHTEVEAPLRNAPTSSQQQVSEQPEAAGGSENICSPALQRKKKSNGTSRSTGSFHSAVDAGILDQPSPNEESQWEDCRSTFEVPEPAKYAMKNEISVLESSDSVDGAPQNADSRVEIDKPTNRQSCGKDQELDHIDHVSGTVQHDATTNENLEPSEEGESQNEKLHGSHNNTENGSSDVSPEEAPSRGSKRNSILDSDLAESKRSDEDRASTDVPCTALSAALQTNRNTECTGRNTDKATDKPEVASNDVEAYGSREGLDSDELPFEDPAADHFEFKAPKPKSFPRDQSSQSEQAPIRASADLKAIVHQTPTQAIKRDNQARETKRTLLQRHFAVDEGGKIDDTGIGLLSEIASTPATAAKGNKSNTLNNQEEGIIRGTKLFKPNNDIYSAQRKPALSRVLSVQKSTLASRGSLLSHTPGAQAPSTRLARDSTLSGVFTNSLRESLAALKQPIIDRNVTLATGDGDPRPEGTQGSQEPGSTRGKEQTSLGVPVGKRLTFADGYKRQLEGGLSQSSRGFEPQTAPTKEFRQPRIRRDTEKSALRRRIEEIRGKASSLSVTNSTHPRASSSNSATENLSESNTNGETSNERMTESRAETKSEVLERGSERSRTSRASTEGEQVATALSIETITNDSRIQDSVFSGDARKENNENTETNPLPQETETEYHSTTEGEEMDEGGEDMKESELEVEEGNGNVDNVDVVQEDHAPKNILSNLMTSVSSLYSGSSILGTRANEEKQGDTASEQAAKRQRLDTERREAERQARMEAQRAARQKEAEEKQRRAEARRQLLAEAEKAKEEERKRKELHRKKVKLQEEEERKRKKLEEDRKKEERRRQVLEKRAMNLELQAKRKPLDGKRQRHIKMGDRGMSSIPKPSGLGGKHMKGYGYGGGKHVGKFGSPGMRDEEEREMNSYDMTPAKATVIEESDEETERRRGKVIPEWAGERNLAISARSQPDPDKVFVNMPMCNLRDVFGNQKQYRTRSSSANWTQDRVTSSEMTRYKKAIGGFRDA